MGKSKLNHAYTVLKSELVDTDQARDPGGITGSSLKPLFQCLVAAKRANKWGSPGRVPQGQHGGFCFAAVLNHDVLMFGEPRVTLATRPTKWSYRKSREGQPARPRAWKSCLTRRDFLRTKTFFKPSVEKHLSFFDQKLVPVAASLGRGNVTATGTLSEEEGANFVSSTSSSCATEGGCLGDARLERHGEGWAAHP